MAFPDYFTEPQQPLGTVYVVDDDEAVCDSVRWLLEAGNYKVEIFDSGESFIAKYDPQAIAVLLLDVRMSGMSGLEVQEHLIARKADLPIIILTAYGHLHVAVGRENDDRKADLPIIILTAYGDVQMAVNALKKGAVDFIEKPFDHAALRQLVEKMLGEARRRRSLNEREAAGRQKLAKLTPRERQVLERIVAGRLNKQIADDLGISIKTVEAHRASIMDKTASGTVADLMRVVMDSGERL